MSLLVARAASPLAPEEEDDWEADDGPEVSCGAAATAYKLPRRRIRVRVNVVAKLKQQAAARRAEIGELQRSGLRLRKQEELLLQTLQHQGDVLRVKARLALARRDADDVDAATIDALVKDVEAGLLLQQVQGGGGGGGGGNAAPYMCRMLSDAEAGVGSNSAAASAGQEQCSATPAAPAAAQPARAVRANGTSSRQHEPTAAEVEAAPLEALAAILKKQTMRLALALAQEGKRATQLRMEFGDTLEEAADAYARTNLLLHTHADAKLLQLCLLNLETLQEEQPPEGFWQQVTEELQLTAEQREALAAAFDIYDRRQRALADEMREASAALEALLQASSPEEAAAGPAAGARPSAAGAIGSADAQPPAALWQQLGPGGAGWAQAPVSERAEPLLAQLLAASTQLREARRALVMTFVNQMMYRQRATSIVEAWPFLNQPVSLAAVVAAEARLAVVADAPVPPAAAQPGSSSPPDGHESS